jgi:hypothetical protein
VLRILLSLFLFITVSAHAEVWSYPIEVHGNGCDPNALDVLDNGNTLSVLFTELGINMPQGDRGDGLRAGRYCRMIFPFQEPRGYRVVKLHQLVDGGVIKSVGAQGTLRAQYRVSTAPWYGKNLAAANRIKEFPRAHAIDADSNFSLNLDSKFVPGQCGRTLYFTVYLEFIAERRNLNQFFIGAVDSFDTDLAPMILAQTRPQWQKCKR